MTHHSPRRRSLLLGFAVIVMGLAAGAAFFVWNGDREEADGRVAPGHGELVALESFPEPSGIVFHPHRRTLFVVSDEGFICEADTTGRLLRERRDELGDLEAITVDPATGRLYAADERAGALYEIHPSTLEVERRILIDPQFNGQRMLDGSNSGIEGVAFIPDETHPEGGTFFLTDQATVEDDPGANQSAVFELEVPLRSATRPEVVGRIVAWHSVDVMDLSDAFYDGSSRRLYVISDSADVLLLFDRDTLELEPLRGLPGRHQEGITLDDSGTVWIAQDSGGLLRMPFDNLPLLDRINWRRAGE